jgi:hypothetical protein
VLVPFACRLLIKIDQKTVVHRAPISSVVLTEAKNGTDVSKRKEITGITVTLSSFAICFRCFLVGQGRSWQRMQSVEDNQRHLKQHGRRMTFRLISFQLIARPCASAAAD